MVLGHRFLRRRHHSRLIVRSCPFALLRARCIFDADRQHAVMIERCTTPGVLGIAISQSNVPANMWGFAAYYMSCFVLNFWAYLRPKSWPGFGLGESVPC